MAHNIFKGLGIALITPFTSDGSVDYDALKRIIDYQLDNGADFLCILATTVLPKMRSRPLRHLLSIE